jgi:hypothetical protein
MLLSHYVTVFLSVVPGDPRDEAFSQIAYKTTCGVEDSLVVGGGGGTVRTAALEAREGLHLRFPGSPIITLEYPDPFAEDFPAGGYTEVVAGEKGGKGKAPAPAAAGAGAAGGDVGGTGGARSQVRRLM